MNTNLPSSMSDTFPPYPAPKAISLSAAPMCPAIVRIEYLPPPCPGVLAYKHESTTALEDGVPQTFIDAMTIRHAVFVKEQNVDADRELDATDARCHHWVAYASTSNTSEASREKLMRNNFFGDIEVPIPKPRAECIPIATIRLVTPPSVGQNVDDEYDSVDQLIETDEQYIKLGRLAVLPEYRHTGIARFLVTEVLRFVVWKPSVVPLAEHPGLALFLKSINGSPKTKTNPKCQNCGSERTQEEEDDAKRKVKTPWEGLVLVHVQMSAKKFWEKLGFIVDQKMGEWDEEGIKHVGMWLRIGPLPPYSRRYM